MSHKYRLNKEGILILILILFTSCATHKTKYADKQPIKNIKVLTDPNQKKIFLFGNTGIGDTMSQMSLSLYKKFLDSASTKKDILIILGDNLDNGMPIKNHIKREFSEEKLNDQIAVIEDFSGKIVFIPGDRGWKGYGVEGLKRQENYLKKKLNDKKVFLPKDGCPLESVEIDDTTHLLIIDSQWYMANWDKYPTVNDECEIKTRSNFFVEIQNELKKNKYKTIILAMHHPVYSNGPYGGKYSFRNQFFPFGNNFPLPILGSLITEIRSQGGLSPQDILNKRYSDLMRRLSVMIRDANKVIVVSAHERSLQYIDDNGLKQIISGTVHRGTPTTLGKNGRFAHSGPGFSTIRLLDDGSSFVNFYGVSEKGIENLYQDSVFKKDSIIDASIYPEKFEEYTEASVYNKKATERSEVFSYTWGKHYRYIYGQKLRVPVVTLDTLLGGMKIDRSGGGQQTRSLRLIDKEGKRYSLRAVKKSATQFLQKGAFVNTYLEDNFEDTFTEEILADFYTASHPYVTFAIGHLSEAIDIYHTNLKLYYIPKHKTLGRYNSEYGDELYIFEERPGKEFTDVESFGNPDDIESTDDMLNNLRRDEEYKIDKKNYIRARLFDMLIGDWDRHTDQWRWARFDKGEERIYRPIPRDRDQAFCNYDGALTNFIKFIIPATRKFEVYDEDLNNVRWINESGIKLDRALVSEADEKMWVEQAEYIQKYMTDDKIKYAFDQLPKEVRDSVALNIEENLKLRRSGLKDIARRYYNYLARHIVVTGTDKDDFFEITRQKNTTEIKVFRLIDGKPKKQFFSKIIDAKVTNEVWIYGLDNNDQFLVKGKGRRPVKIRIVGGQDNDTYEIQRGRKIRIYDHLTKSNTVKNKGGAYFQLSDNYNQNLYDINKNIDHTNTITPLLGFNPDDGMNINVTDSYTKRGFYKEPFHNKHILKAAYFVATEGYDLSYQGDFTKMVGSWSLLINARYTSENYAQNFFGFGNNSLNPDDELGFNYNRTKTGIISLSAGLKKTGYYGSEMVMKAGLESVEVEDSSDRFITSTSGLGTSDTDFFNRKKFSFIDINYNYGSYDNIANPTKGMGFSLTAGVKMNLENTKNTFVYLNPKLQFYNAITQNRKLVLKNEVISGFTLGDGYEFYQAPNIGGNTGLRGYRTERFTGDRTLAFTNDLRYSFNKFRTGLLPLQLGIYGGYDIGRVWYDDEDSDIWHDSYGGGFWINAVDAISGQLGLFYSDDGPRFSFGFGVNL